MIATIMVLRDQRIIKTIDVMMTQMKKMITKSQYHHVEENLIHKGHYVYKYSHIYFYNY